VQRATLDDGQDGDMLGQSGVLQVEEAGVLDAQALVAADELAHGRLPADHPLPWPVMKGRRHHKRRRSARAGGSAIAWPARGTILIP
jgi:hypothetical protein